MRRYEYRKLRRGPLPPEPARVPGNSPESITVAPGVEVTGQPPTISVTEYTVSADGTTRILHEESS